MKELTPEQRELERRRNLLEDVVNELELSSGAIEKHGQLGTPPAELVRLVLNQKDMEIKLLRRGFVPLHKTCKYCGKEVLPGQGNSLYAHKKCWDERYPINYDELGKTPEMEDKYGAILTAHTEPEDEKVELDYKAQFYMDLKHHTAEDGDNE